MKNRFFFFPIIFVTLIGTTSMFTLSLFSQSPLTKSNVIKLKGSYYTGKYKNLFTQILRKTESQVQNKVNKAFEQLFYGDNKKERVFYTVEPDMGYIEDILHKDVRTEGMSYGMMIAVQMDKKQEFDRLWKWVKTYMQHKKGPLKNYFAWHCQTNGLIIDSNSASDGEEWFVMALFFASKRWGNGNGIYNYKTEAQIILDEMLNKESEPENDGKTKNMFSKKEKQVVFVPSIEAAGFTDPSYHLPHYYELWARWADKNNRFWCDAASSSRNLLKKSAHPATGLTPDYSNFDGSPVNPWNGGSDNFQYDAWRVAMNIAVDYSWFSKDEWEVTECNKLIIFFHSAGIGKYGDLYKLDGKNISENHSIGLMAMNAVACLASTDKRRKDFLQELWDTPIPHGDPRYYDGLLYMLAYLQVSGNFRIYDPSGIITPDCSKISN
jgi:endo-1,4-beta-D-glucanase Y